MLFYVKYAWQLVILSMLANGYVYADEFSGHACQLPSQQALTESYNTFQNHKWKMEDDGKCLNEEINLPADYFMLSLSYSPRFCQKHGSDPKNSYQCHSGNNFKWVAHGLWAQANNPSQCADNPGMALHPRYCQGDAYPVISAEEVSKNLCVQPGLNLVETEWAKHGSCSGLAPNEYVQKTRDLYQQLELPDQDMQPPKIYQWMKQNNSALKNIFMDYDNNAHELHICFDKQFNYMNCPSKATASKKVGRNN